VHLRNACCLQETFETRFVRVASVELGTPASVAGTLAKDASSDESSSEDDSDAVEREKQLAALQQQVGRCLVACHLCRICSNLCVFVSLTVCMCISAAFWQNQFFMYQ